MTCTVSRPTGYGVSVCNVAECHHWIASILEEKTPAHFENCFVANHNLVVPVTCEGGPHRLVVRRVVEHRDSLRKPVVVVTEFIRSLTEAWRLWRETKNYSPHLGVWVLGLAHNVVKQALEVIVFTAVGTRCSSSETYEERGTMRDVTVIAACVSAATTFWSHLYAVAAQRSCVDEGGIFYHECFVATLFDSPGTEVEGMNTDINEIRRVCGFGDERVFSHRARGIESAFP